MGNLGKGIIALADVTKATALMGVHMNTIFNK